MTRTKIFFIITKSNWGGASKYVYDLATLLPSLAYDVTVVFGGTGELAHRLEEKNIKTVSVPQLGRDIHVWDDVLVFFSLLSLFFRERPAVIHLNSSKIGGLGALAARLYNCFEWLKPSTYRLRAKIIFTAHGWPFREERPRWQTRLIRFASWLTIALAHEVIAVSKHDAADGRAMPCAAHKLRCIYNGIGPISFLSREDARAEIMRGHGTVLLPGNAVWIGTNAELTRNKGLVYAIEAMARLVRNTEFERPFVYIIIGDGEQKEMLSRKITKLGLNGKVFLVGTKKDAARLLPAFDCFLLSSIKEGLPYALLEAGLARLPIIATRVGGIPEIVEDGKMGILIQPKNSLAIAESLVILLSDKEKGSAYGNALSEKIKRVFSIERMVAATEEMYSAR